MLSTIPQGRDVNDQADEVYLTMEEVLGYSGYKERTIYNAVSKGELERLPDKTFPKSAVDEWLTAKGKLPGNSDSEDDELSPASVIHQKAVEEARYRKFRARREEILVLNLEGNFIPRTEVDRQFTARAAEFKSALMLFSRRVAHRIAAQAGMEIPEVSMIIDEEAAEVLAAMTRKMEIKTD